MHTHMHARTNKSFLKAITETVLIGAMRVVLIGARTTTAGHCSQGERSGSAPKTTWLWELTGAGQLVPGEEPRGDIC